MTYACMGVALILAGDFLILRFTPNRIAKIYYHAIIRHVDIPMFVGFGFVSGLIYFFLVPIQSDTDLSALFAGATAFQLVAFNILFLLVWDSIIRLSAGEYSPLVIPEGGLVSDPDHFVSAWRRHFSPPTEQ
jgi:hypothetical protein